MGIYNPMDAIQEITHSVLSFSSDAIVVLIFIAVGTAVSLYYGKARILALIFSFYPTILLFDIIPFFDSRIDKNPVSLSSAVPAFAFFLLLFAFSFFAIRKLIMADFSFSRLKRTLESIVFGTVFASLIIYCSYHVIITQKIYNFSASIDTLFLSTVAFWWLIIPLVLVFIFKR